MGILRVGGNRNSKEKKTRKSGSFLNKNTKKKRVENNGRSVSQAN